MTLLPFEEEGWDEGGLVVIPAHAAIQYRFVITQKNTISAPK